MVRCFASSAASAAFFFLILLLVVSGLLGWNPACKQRHTFA